MKGLERMSGGYIKLILREGLGLKRTSPRTSSHGM
jgi:hypothetical protein